MDDLEEKLNAWVEEKERWEDVIAHIKKVQEYGAKKFLVKTKNSGVDVDFLYIS